MSATSAPYCDEQIAELLRQYALTRDGRLRDAVVVQMRPLVRHVARKFAGKEPLEDLEGEGYIGLIRAVDRFTPGKGSRFSTFATHLIAGQIRHYLRDRGHLIRQPAWLQELSSRVQRAAAELEQRLQREPTVAELAAATNVTEEGIEELLSAQAAARVFRLEASSSDEDGDFLDVDPEKIKARDYQTLSLPIEDRIVLENALEKLKELERNVLENFFFGDFNQSEIARKLGISCNYTGYLLRNGLKHMKERLPQESEANRGMERVEETVMDRETGVYTKTHFERRLNEEIRRAQYFAHSVSVCCIRLPENASAHAMENAASVLRSRTRRADIVARTGKREFGVIFPNTDEVAARVSGRLGEEIHRALGLPVHVASSTYPDHGRNPLELFEAARQAAGRRGAPEPSSVPSLPLRAACL